jgi:hypothetical protein
LHSVNDQRSEELVAPQAYKEDAVSALTSASATVNKEDGSWGSASASQTVDSKTDSPRRHTVKVLLPSSTVVLAQDSIACQPATASAVASRMRAAPYLASESFCPVLRMSNAQSLEEVVAPQTCKEDGSLASTSVSGTVHHEDGFSASS